MSKTIVFMRHGKAESVYGVSDDFDRKLLPEGVDMIRKSGELLGSLGIVVDYLVSSDALRAMQTSDEMLNMWNEVSLEKQHFIYEGYTTGQMLDFIAGVSDRVETLMIVGHNPDIEVFVNNMVADGELYFRPATAVVVEFPVDGWSDLSIRTGIVKSVVMP